MNKKLATLILLLLGMAFTSSVYAFELDEFGTVSIHGFLSQGYLITDENNFYADTENGGTSQFNEFGINFKSNVSDRLRVGGQFLSRDLGRMGNNDVTIDWALADYSFTDWLNLRAGLVKIPFGLYNMERDVDMLRTFVFLPQSFYNEGWRDSETALNGAGIYGYIPAGMLGEFSYDVYGGNTHLKPEMGVMRLLENAMPTSLGMKVIRPEVSRTNAASLTWDTIFGVDGLKVVCGAWDVDLDVQVEYNNGKLSFWDLDAVTGAQINPYILANIQIAGLQAGVDYTTPQEYAAAVTTITTNQINTAIANGTYSKERSSAMLQARNLTSSVSVEYSFSNWVWAAEVMQNDLKFNFITFEQKYRTLGWYTSLTHRFTDWLEMGVCYGEYYANQDDKDGKKVLEGGDWKGVNPPRPWQKDLTLAARFDLTENWIFKLEGHSIDGATLLLRDENESDALGFPLYERKYLLGAAKLTYSF